MKMPPRSLALVVAGWAVAQVSGAQSPDSQAPGSIGEDEYRILGGSAGGGISAFINELGSVLNQRGVEFGVVAETSTSALNLTTLRDNDADNDPDFALAPSDQMYREFYAEDDAERNTSFRAVMPLYIAYQQIFVRADSGIDEVADLAGRNIALGRDSASFVHAKDMLEAVGIYDDERIVNRGSGPGLALLQFCDAAGECADQPAPTGNDDPNPGRWENLPSTCQTNPTECGIAVDAVILTGSARTRPGLKHIPVPEDVLATLARERVYYSSTAAPPELAELIGPPEDDEPAFDQPMLTVTYYLVARDEALNDRVRRITQAIYENWDALLVALPDMVDLETELLKELISFHPAADEYLYAASAELSSVYRVLGGSAGGGISSFINQLGSKLDEQGWKLTEDEPDSYLHESFRIVAQTSNSARNLTRLKDNEAEFALAPSDLMYRVYHSDDNNERNTSFRAVMPLYVAYQQVFVRQASDIEEFADLADKNIAIGRNSVSFLHAMDVLTEAGMFNNERIFDHGSGAGLALLQFCDADGVCDPPGDDEPGADEWSNLPPNCQANPSECGIKIDAVILTGSARTRPKLKHISVPEVVLDALAGDPNRPYYSKTNAPAELAELAGPPEDDEPAFDRPMLTVTYYLVARADESLNDRVYRVTRAIHKNWIALSVALPDMVDLGTELKKEVVDFHPGADRYLMGESLRTGIRLYWLFFIVSMVVIFGLCFYAVRSSRRKYDRLGRTSTADPVGVFSEWAVAHLKGIRNDFYAVALGSVVVLLVTAWLMLLAVSVIKMVEGGAASSVDQANDFADMGPIDSLLWMFTWMATGFENSIYPISNLSRLAVAFIGLAGVAAPVTILVSIIAIRSTRRTRRERGEGGEHLKSIRNHTLICGWNTKVPGLIYSLTGEDSPGKLDVVVIAEMDDEFPLRKYGFDSRHVTYFRGDSARLETLNSVNAQEAKNAVIVAGQKRLETMNAGSALTAIALRSINPDIFLVGERGFQTDVENFQVSEDWATVIDGRRLAQRLIALATDNPNIVDFVLELLTYDEFSECSSKSVADICDVFKLDATRTSAGDLFLVLWAAGLNVLGICIRSGEFAGRSNFLLTQDDHNYFLRPEDEVILVCDDVRYIQHHNRKNWKTTITEGTRTEFDTRMLNDTEHARRILLVGDRGRAEGIAAELGISLNDDDFIDTLPPTEQGNNDAAVRQVMETRLRTKKYGCVVVLNGTSVISSKDHGASYVGDAEVIIRCQLAKDLAKDLAKESDRATPFSIVGEINRPANATLLEQIGIDAVVSTGIVVQRFLSKPIFDNNYTTELIFDLMNQRGSAHLRSIRLHDKHPLVKKPFSEALRTVFADGRVVACVPTSHVERLTNTAGDFRTHFDTTPGQGSEDVVLGPGDLVVCIVTRQD